MSTTTPAPLRNLPPFPSPEHKHALDFGEIARFAYDTFCSNKIRFALTALGMVIGNASLILVVTIGMTGKQYILNQIQAIGANMVYITQEGTGNQAENTIAQQDLLSLNDMRAIREQVPGIRASSPMVELHDRIPVGNGKERDVLILGVSPEYLQVRNLDVPTGRFFDDDDTKARNKVAVATEMFAIKQFGSVEEAIGRRVQLNGLPFTIIGTFRERVETFGQSGIADETLLIPYTVAQYFTGNESREPDLFLTGRCFRCAASDATDSARDPGASPRGCGVPRGQLIRTAGCGRKIGQCPDFGAAASRHGDLDSQRRGNHEHHAGDGDVAHSRNWRAQGTRSDQP